MELKDSDDSRAVLAGVWEVKIMRQKVTANARQRLGIRNGDTHIAAATADAAVESQEPRVRCCRIHLQGLLLPFGQEIAESSSLRLIEEFGSLGAVLAAAPRLRGAVLRDRPAVSRHLTKVRGAMLHALRTEALPGPEIAGTRSLARYLRADMGYRASEQLRILFLAAGNRLLSDEILFQGSIDSTPLLPRPIVHRALDLGASGLILVHNHPSGNAEPSSADIAATRELITACRLLEIVVHDHLIVARAGWTSLRLKGLM